MVDARTNYARDISQLVIDTYSNQIGVFHTCIPLSVRAAKKDSGTEILYILQPTDCGDRDECHTPKEWMGEFNLEESEEWFCVWQDIVSTLSEKITEVLPKVSGELENALFTGMGGLLYLKYDIEKPLLPQVKENGAKALGIVSGIDDMMKMFGH